MTLVRTALRLATINALQGADGNSGPTAANNRVYDSRITDLDPEAFEDDAKPTIIVLTDSDEGEQLSRQNGGPPFRRNIDLVFELGMIQKVRDDTGFDLEYPQTDAQLEAALDVLEFQIARRLGYDPDASCAVFRRFFRPQKRECHRQVMDDAGVKIACRLLTWTVDGPDDQVQVYNAANTPLPTGIAALPDPLKTIAGTLAPGSSGAQVVAAIAAALAPLTAPQLKGFDATSTANGAGDGTPTVDQTLNFPPAT